MVSIKVTHTYEEDSYTNILIDIYNDSTKIGDCSLMVDENSAYCERIDIDEEYRNHGYGTEALYKLSSEYDGVVVAPDNEDAKRLYERIGREYDGDDADYIDQGFGVYKI